MNEIYISVDIEANGPCPGLNSMLSFAAVAFDHSRPVASQEMSSFSANLELLEGAKPDKDTEIFWAKNLHAYEATRQNVVHPKDAMRLFRDWLRGIPGKKICVAFPAGFDFTFLYYYSHLFLGESPLGFSSLDSKTYAACLLNSKYSDASKKNFPSEWFDKSKPHTHVALDDAREQGFMFMRQLDTRKSMELNEKKFKNMALDLAIQRLEALKAK